MHEQVQLASGLRVELCIDPPDAKCVSDGISSKRLAVLLHPWSWLGGNMNDPVLQCLSEVFTKNGYHVVRYNSRGVGRSSGWPSFSGQQEVKDVQEVVRWGMERVENVERVVIVGYSYGSIISSCHPVLPPPVKTAHLILSYPLDKRGLLTLFHSSTYASALTKLVKDPASRVLIVYGDRDEFTGAQSYVDWTEQLRGDAESSDDDGSDKLRLARIEGGSHFWAASRRKAEEMSKVVEDWIVQWAN